MLCPLIDLNLILALNKLKPKKINEKKNEYNFVFFLLLVLLLFVLFHLLFTNSSLVFSQYFFTISLMHHRCWSNNVLANDGTHFNVVQRHSIDSFKSFSTSSTVKHSKIKLSGSVLSALWCSISMSSFPTHYQNMYKIKYSYSIYFIENFVYLYYSNHHIRIHYQMNIPYPSLTFWKVKFFWRNLYRGILFYVFMTHETDLIICLIIRI